MDGSEEETDSGADGSNVDTCVIGAVRALGLDALKRFLKIHAARLATD
jgi:hypothetical protein